MSAVAKKLFVGVPVYGNVDPHFFYSFTSFWGQYDKPVRLHKPQAGDSLVARARNRISREFLESDCTHLLWIDSDIVFTTQMVDRLLWHDVDIVGGLYCKKNSRNNNCEFVLNGIKGEHPNDQGLVSVRYIGTGFMLIKRRVFEMMLEQWGKEIVYNLDYDQQQAEPGTVEHDFWRVGVYQYKDGTRRYLSEDWFFCQRWLDLGGKVYADTKVIVDHSGSAVYPLPHQQQAILNAARDGVFKSVPATAIPTLAGATPFTEV